MIACSYYSSVNDISGVTTWLEGLMKFIVLRGDEFSINLHHFGDDPDAGSIYLSARAIGVEAVTQVIPPTTEASVRDTLEFLNRTQPDVFVPQGLPGPHYAAQIAERNALPWVFTIHSDDPVFWAIAGQTGPKSKDGIWVAVSEAIGAEARARFPHADVRVISYGVRVPGVQSAWSRDRFRVVYSGRLIEEQKRISQVVDTLVLACQQSDFIEAVIIGDGPERERMTAAVVEAGMKERIRFAGHLSPSYVEEELLQAQAIVLMSDYEGLPVALLEAMACGVVPIVRDIRSGIPEIVHSGVTGLVVHDNPIEAAAMLVTLSKQEVNWRTMSVAARDLVQGRYSYEQSMMKWCGILDELRSRSKVVYPIPVPRRLKLPPYDVRLKSFDRRTPGRFVSIVRNVRKLARGGLRRMGIDA